VAKEGTDVRQAELKERLEGPMGSLTGDSNLGKMASTENSPEHCNLGGD
jgi:hypothetical protein